MDWRGKSIEESRIHVLGFPPPGVKDRFPVRVEYEVLEQRMRDMNGRFFTFFFRYLTE